MGSNWQVGSNEGWFMILSVSIHSCKEVARQGIVILNFNVSGSPSMLILKKETVTTSTQAQAIIARAGLWSKDIWLVQPLERQLTTSTDEL